MTAKTSTAGAARPNPAKERPAPTSATSKRGSSVSGPAGTQKKAAAPGNSKAKPAAADAPATKGGNLVSQQKPTERSLANKIGDFLTGSTPANAQTLPPSDTAKATVTGTIPGNNIVETKNNDGSSTYTQKIGGANIKIVGSGAVKNGQPAGLTNLGADDLGVIRAMDASGKMYRIGTVSTDDGKGGTQKVTGISQFDQGATNFKSNKDNTVVYRRPISAQDAQAISNEQKAEADKRLPERKLGADSSAAPQNTNESKLSSNPYSNASAGLGAGTTAATVLSAQVGAAFVPQAAQALTTKLPVIGTAASVVYGGADGWQRAPEGKKLEGAVTVAGGTGVGAYVGGSIGALPIFSGPTVGLSIPTGAAIGSWVGNQFSGFAVDSWNTKP